MNLTWQETTNIEASLIDFLRTELINDGVKLLDNSGVSKSVNVYAGKQVNNNWNLPLIQVYFESKPDLGRLEIGDNARLKSWLIILDIRTLLSGQELNLADWIETILLKPVPYYSYVQNSPNPDYPIKQLTGYMTIDFITSTSIPNFDDTDVYEQNRYRLAIKVWLNSNI